MCIMYLGHTHNFNKAPAEVTDAFGVGYDYSSVMHYSSTAFSKNNQLKTIVPKVRTRSIIYHLYKCSRRFSAFMINKQKKKDVHILRITWAAFDRMYMSLCMFFVRVRRIYQTVAFWILLAESSRVTPERSSVRGKVLVRRTFWRSGGCTNAANVLAFIMSMIISDGTRRYL